MKCIARPPNRTCRGSTIWASATSTAKVWRRSGGGGQVVSQSRRAEFRRGSIQFGPLLRRGCARGRRPRSDERGGGEVVSKSAEQITPRLKTIWASDEHGRTEWRRIGGGGEVVRKAAEQNYAEAQVSWACATTGRPGTEDWTEAYKWLSLAARQGHEGAKKNMTSLESKLMT